MGRTRWKSVGIGDAFKAAREKAGMTIYEAAENAGCDPSYLSKLEKNLQEPSLAFALVLAGVLKVSMSQLCKEVRLERKEEE